MKCANLHMEHLKEGVDVVKNLSNSFKETVPSPLKSIWSKRSANLRRSCLRSPSACSSGTRQAYLTILVRVNLVKLIL